MIYEDIAKRIIELKHADLELRDRLIQKGKLGDGYNEDMMELHNKNAEILNEIIDMIGYPTIDKVGEEASEASWLIIQHAISQPHFMKKCAKLLENAVHENQANPKNLAYLIDRLAVFEGNPQLYGTQFDWSENSELTPHAMDDLAKVNQRRKSLGLNTVEEQAEILKRQIKSENQLPPKDFKRRKEEFEKWKNDVGWKK